MLSVVLLFGLINTISGNNTSILQSSNITVGEVVESSLAYVTNTYFSTIKTSAVLNNTRLTNEPRRNSSVPKTRQSSASVSVWTLIATQHPPRTSRAALTPTTSSVLSFSEKSGQSAPVTSVSSTAIQATTTGKTTKTTEKTTTGKTTKTTEEITPTKTGKTTKTTEKTTNKEKVFWWHVETGTLKFMFYGAAAVAIVCLISLVAVCCCWRRQSKTVKKLQKQATTLSNPYVNNRVIGFPSPLQLDTFIIKPESPYDTPGPVETIPEDVEVSYVSVIDGNESESDYAAVKENGTASSVADSASRDNPMPSPVYTNASVFQMDPYQELIPANRSNEDHYTSLINREENEENKGEVTV